MSADEHPRCPYGNATKASRCVRIVSRKLKLGFGVSAEAGYGFGGYDGVGDKETEDGNLK